MASTNTLPPPQSAFVDSTGKLSDDGYQFLLNLLNQIATQQPTATVGSGVKATGGSQATAAPLTGQWNEVTSGLGGVLLSTLQPGQSQLVDNQTSFAIEVYPPAGYAINNPLGVNGGYSLGPGSMQIFQFMSTAFIRTAQLQIP